MTLSTFPEIAYDIIELLTIQELLSSSQIEQSLPENNPGEIRYAIRRLQEHHVVQIEPNLLDMRSSTYRLSSPNELEKAHELLTANLYSRIVNKIVGTDEGFR